MFVPEDSMVKVILWDIDGTLLDFIASEKCAIRKCLSIFGIGDVSDEQLTRYSKINQKYWGFLEKGVLTKPEVLRGRFEEFFALENISFSDIDAFNAEYQVRLGDEVFFNEGAFETVTRLKGRVLQFAVTNGTATAQDMKLKKSGLDKIFDGIFISDKIGAEKPTNAFFEQVWKTVGRFSDREAMIVGDSLTSDIQGGNNAGILCCWYNPKGKPMPSDLRVDYQISSIPQIEQVLVSEGGF